MEKIPYTNDQAHTVHVGPVAIAPGQTRMVDPSHLNPPAAAPTEQSPPPDPPAALADLLGKKPGEVTTALPGLADEDLDQLDAMERGAAKPRAKLLEAITAEKIRRSQPPA